MEFPAASLDAHGVPRFVLRLPPALIANDYGAACVFYDDVAGRGWEFSLRRFLDLHLASDDVFIDIGAHFGIHSLTAATGLPGQVSVLAIEPHPQNVARIRDWVALNRLESEITIIPKAVGDREGVLPMWLSGSSMGHSLRTVAHEPDSVPIEVGVTTVDHILAEHPELRWRRFVLKIDVEGCELEVFMGARQLFDTQSVGAVIWEKGTFHEPGEQARRDDAIFAFLDAHGFEHFYMESESKGGRLLPVKSRDLVCNIYSLQRDFDRKERYG